MFMSLQKQLEHVKKEQKKLDQKEDLLNKRIAKEYFKRFTLGGLKEFWNKTSGRSRIYIMEQNPDVVTELKKLDSYGGLTYNELESEIIESKWDCSRWMNMSEFYKGFCQ